MAGASNVRAPRERRRVAEIEDKRAAGRDRDQQPATGVLPPFRQIFWKVQGDLSSRMRALRSPCQRRSTTIIRSVQTVCGQV